MEAVGDLHRPRRTFMDAGGVRGRAVAADDLHARVGTQPRGESRGLSVGQQVNDAALLHVNEDGAVALAAAEGEVIYPEHARRRRAGRHRSAHTPEQGIRAGRHRQLPSGPRAGLAAEQQPDERQRLVEPHALARVMRDDAREPLAEDTLSTQTVLAAEAAGAQLQRVIR